jgi:hypothetical protein
MDCEACQKPFQRGFSVLEDVSPMPSDRKRVIGEYCLPCAPDVLHDLLRHPDFHSLLVRRLEAPKPATGVLGLLVGFVKGWRS